MPNWITYEAWRSNIKPHVYTDILARMWNNDKKSAHFSQIGLLSSITFLKSYATTLRRNEKRRRCFKHIPLHCYSPYPVSSYNTYLVPFYLFWGAVSYLAIICANDSFRFKTLIGKYTVYCVLSDGTTFSIHSCLL